MFLGGQTVTLGKCISDIGKVSIVVEIGLFDQDAKDSWIKRDAPTNPAMTIDSQKSLANFLVDAKYETP